MKKVFLFVILLGLAALSANAQERNLRTESDGFQWYNTFSSDRKYEGAESVDGTTLIPLSRQYTTIYYHSVKGHKGYFKVKQNQKYGAWDIYGKEIIAPKYNTLFYYEGDGFNYKDEQGKYIPLDITLDANGRVSFYENTEGSSSYASSSSSSSSSYSSNYQLYIQYFQEGNVYFEKGKYRKAEKSFKQAAQYNDTYDVNYNIGISAYNRSNYQDAIYYYEKCQRLDPNEAKKDNIANKIEKSQRAYARKVQNRQAAGAALLGAALGVTNAALQNSAGGPGPAGDPQYQAYLNYRNSGLPGASTISFEDFKKANARAAANGYQVGNSSSSSSSNNNSSQNNHNNSQNRCPLCSGTGTTVEYSVTFGLGENKYCKECGKTVAAGHYHQTCKMCGGKGYK